MLSKRLRTIADAVPSGSSVADIGSDHALLPTYLVQSGRCHRAIAGELNEGPYLAAVRQVAQAGLQQSVHVRRGDGLQVITPAEVDVITISGMGGNLIVSILEAGRDTLIGVQTLVLQPNVGERAVRQWLHAHGWLLQAEQIIEEDGHIYEILVADHLSTGRAHSEQLYQTLPPCIPDESWMFRMGPYLLRQAHPLLYTKWRAELLKWQRIQQQLAGAQSSEAQEKRAEVCKKIVMLEGILQCLPTANM